MSLKSQSLAFAYFTLSLCGLFAADTKSIDDPTTPIPYGYLFFEYQFIPGPYVVSSLGQTVLVNGIVVAQSAVVPAKPKSTAESVITVPPPIPDVTGDPCDGEYDSYRYWEWRRRALLGAEKDALEARARLIQEMNSHYKRTVAIPDPDSPESILILEEYQGKEVKMLFSMRGITTGFTVADPVGTAVTSKELYADLVRRQLWKDNIVWIYNKESGIAIVNPDFHEVFLRELVDDASPEIRYDRLVKLGAIHSSDDLWVKFVHGVTDLAPLRQQMQFRVERLKPKIDKPTISSVEPLQELIRGAHLDPQSSPTVPLDVLPIDNNPGIKASKSVGYIRILFGSLVTMFGLLVLYKLFFRKIK